MFTLWSRSDSFTSASYGFNAKNPFYKFKKYVVCTATHSSRLRSNSTIPDAVELKEWGFVRTQPPWKKSRTPELQESSHRAEGSSPAALNPLDGALEAMVGEIDCGFKVGVRLSWSKEAWEDGWCVARETAWDAAEVDMMELGAWDSGLRQEFFIVEDSSWSCTRAGAVTEDEAVETPFPVEDRSLALRPRVLGMTRTVFCACCRDSVSFTALCFNSLGDAKLESIKVPPSADSLSRLFFHAGTRISQALSRPMCSFSSAYCCTLTRVCLRWYRREPVLRTKEVWNSML